MREGKYRLAVVQSHVIEYFGPFFHDLAQHPDVELMVYYGSRQGAETTYDREFGIYYQWDRPLLDGYRSHVVRAKWQLIREIRRGRFDAVLVYGWATRLAWSAFLASRLSRVPYLIAGDSIPQAGIHPMKRILKAAILGPLFRRAAAFLTMGALNERLYREFGVPEEKFFLVPYSPDVEYFRREALAARQRKEEYRRHLGIDPTHPVILFVGKFVRRKRPVDVLRAFGAVSKRGFQASLALCGDGPLRGEMEEYVREEQLTAIHFLGFKNQGDMPRVYAMSDILVLPSDHEPWGVVLNEAMACGLPVVVSDRVGAAGEPRFLQHRRNGIVYPVGDIQALAEGLAELLGDKGLLTDMARVAAATMDCWNYDLCVHGVVKALGYVCDSGAS